MSESAALNPRAWLVKHAKWLAEVVRTHEQEMRRTAPNLDFFEMLGIARKEERHTRFLASLLDPNGIHCQGSLFLDAFLEQLELEPTRDGESWIVVPEFAITDSRGGQRFIDILVRSEARLIVIENKIDAGEHGDQCVEYHEWMTRTSSGQGAFVYLTLDLSTSESLDREQRSHLRISYDRHIRRWLEPFADPASSPNAEPVRSLLAQYLRTIERLYGSPAMPPNQKLVDILRKQENFAHAIAIEEALPRVRFELESGFWDSVCDSLKSALEAAALRWEVHPPEREHFEDAGPYVRAQPAALACEGENEPPLYVSAQGSRRKEGGMTIGVSFSKETSAGVQDLEGIRLLAENLGEPYQGPKGRKSWWAASRDDLLGQYGSSEFYVVLSGGFEAHRDVIVSELVRVITTIDPLFERAYQSLLDWRARA